MVLTLLGALLVFGGLLFLVALPIWRGRLSDVRRTPMAAPEPTLEPPKPGAGLYAKENWIGLALMALGGTLLLLS
ncbi:hypothetical protein V1291_000356 [Nitrobacteraceae bacterium AZCC 1564]